MKKILAIISFFSLSGGLIWLIFFAPYLKIEKIEINGCRQEIKKNIKDIISKSHFNNNILLLPKRKIKNEAIKEMPIISSIRFQPLNLSDIKKNIVKIYVKERNPYGVWCNSDKTSCFYIDRSGVVFKKAPIFGGGLMLCLVDKKNSELRFGSQIISEKKLLFIKEIKKRLVEKLSLNIFEVELMKADELALVVNNAKKENQSWKILLKWREENSVDYFENVMRELINQELKGRTSNIEYVDLRVKNRVYYKLESPQINKLPHESTNNL